jgi:hypothetical protein
MPLTALCKTPDALTTVIRLRGSGFGKKLNDL